MFSETPIKTLRKQFHYGKKQKHISVSKYFQISSPRNRAIFIGSTQCCFSKEIARIPQFSTFFLEENIYFYLKPNSCNFYCRFFCVLHKIFEKFEFDCYYFFSELNLSHCAMPTEHRWIFARAQPP